MRLLPLLLLIACHQDGDAKKEDKPPVETGTFTDADADHDGYTVDQGDCDDENAAAHPDATELCNSIDDNCDGVVDESLGQTWYQDADGDSYGDPATAQTSCEAPLGFLGDASDCDDGDPSIHPGAEELCTDTIDRNCDGSAGAVDGDADGVPACEDCDDRDPGISPNASEICDANNTDEDCDGLADDLDSSVLSSTYTASYTDADGDGYGDDGTQLLSCDGAGVSFGGDCNDGDPAWHPGAAETCDDPNDYNCDGAVGYSDGDGDGFAACLECDDGNSAIFPGATEVCNGADDDCNGQIDEGGAGATTWYADQDGDGFGDDTTAVLACNATTGYIAQGSDCDDQAAGTYPGAAEYCDGVDQDCNGIVDDNPQNPSTYYTDGDGDGFGDATAPVQDCSQPLGAVGDASDCDDTRADVSPLATELCNGIDDDCDGTIDQNAVDAPTWYTDGDGDGYGDAVAAQACEAPAGSVAYNGDCNDQDPAYHLGASESDCTDPNDYNCDGLTGYADADQDGYAACQDCNDADLAIHPGAIENCNAVDDNCDGQIDEAGSVGESTWYADADGDLYGDPSSSLSACNAPSGYVADATDCNDAARSAHPGGAEVCDGLDNDCDGSIDIGAADAASWYADTDGDHYGDPTVSLRSCSQPTGYVADDTDCNDATVSINPGVPEVCDGIDNNCDGIVDSDAVDQLTWYADGDRDSYGDISVSTHSCSQPSGYVADASDCNDAVSAIHPGATEICDGIDNNCDGVTDTDATDRSTWYADADGDGYGDPNTSILACTQPSNYLSDARDCNDAQASVHPGATEVCDSVDNNCDGSTDGSDAWWDSKWPYRVTVTVVGASTDVDGPPITPEVDFRAALDAQGVSSAFDPATMRVVLQDCSLSQPEEPSQFLDGWVSMFEKAPYADPVGDEFGTVAFLYDEDGDYSSLETLPAGATVTFGIYFGGSAGSPGYNEGLSATSSLLSNTLSSASFSSAAGGLLSGLSYLGSPSLQSQATSCCGNSFYGGSWGIDPQDGAGTLTLLESGPVFAAVEASGARSDSQSGYEYWYTYWMFAGRPELWSRVYERTDRASTLSHPANFTGGIRPYEARGDAISSGATFTTDPNFRYADVSNGTWGVLYSYVAPPTYLVGLNNYDPYMIVVGNDVSNASGTPGTLPAGTAFLDNVVQVLLPHTGGFSTVQGSFRGLVEGPSILVNSSEGL